MKASIHPVEKERMMDTTELVEVAVNTWNARDNDGFAALFDEDCEITIPGGVVLRGAEGAQMFWHGYHNAFPDNQVVLRTAISSDDAGTEKTVFEGTHTGPLQSPDGSEIPPTGRHVAVPFVGVSTICSDKIVSYRMYFDQIELLTPLGLMPAPAA